MYSNFRRAFGFQRLQIHNQEINAEKERLFREVAKELEFFFTELYSILKRIFNLELIIQKTNLLNLLNRNEFNSNQLAQNRQGLEKQREKIWKQIHRLENKVYYQNDQFLWFINDEEFESLIRTIKSCVFFNEMIVQITLPKRLTFNDVPFYPYVSTLIEDNFDLARLAFIDINKHKWYLLIYDKFWF